MSHTQGKWEVKDEHVIGDDIFYRIEAGGHGLIALVDATPESDENKTNARLIAAAPDLLEACRWLSDSFTGDTECTEILDYIRTELPKVITKAEGNQCPARE